MDEEAKRTMRVRAHAALSLTLVVKKYENEITKLALAMTAGDRLSPEEMWNQFTDARHQFEVDHREALRRLDNVLVWMARGQHEQGSTAHDVETLLRRWGVKRHQRKQKERLEERSK